MKKSIIFPFAAGLVLLAGCAIMPTQPSKETYSSFDQPSELAASEKLTSGSINFQGVPVDQVLNIYEKLSRRTVIHGALPQVQITLRTEKAINRAEALQMFDTVLAENGIAMVLCGDKAVKAVPVSQTVSEALPEITLPWQQLPDSSSLMMRTVKVEHLKPSEVVPALQPLTKLPNSILAIDKDHLLILRDYSANIRRELQLLQTLDK